jgi:hypothetical protein
MQLFRIARSLIQQVNSERSIIDYWIFGGGTAMMLQIDHRDSHDVDIFLADPQLLAFLDRQMREFSFKTPLAACEGDGTRSLKLVFDRIGQIDFIVAGARTSSPTAQTSIDGETILLDSIPEIITKKIYHRGASMKPRHVFDLAAAGEQHADTLIRELRNYRKQVAQALMVLDKLNVDFVNGAIAQLAIRPQYKEIAKTAIQRSGEILRAV